ncbi:MAG: hypothetical protein KDA63_15660 [Planctomycetales bacterium]|nr:hypothetical protein [Planctomycetales bacterium]
MDCTALSICRHTLLAAALFAVVLPGHLLAGCVDCCCTRDVADTTMTSTADGPVARAAASCCHAATTGGSTSSRAGSSRAGCCATCCTSCLISADEAAHEANHDGCSCPDCGSDASPLAVVDRATPERTAAAEQPLAQLAPLATLVDDGAPRLHGHYLRQRPVTLDPGPLQPLLCVWLA